MALPFLPPILETSRHQAPTIAPNDCRGRNLTLELADLHRAIDIASFWPRRASLCQPAFVAQAEQGPL